MYLKENWSRQWTSTSRIKVQKLSIMMSNAIIYSHNFWVISHIEILSCCYTKKWNLNRTTEWNANNKNKKRALLHSISVLTTIVSSKYKHADIKFNGQHNLYQSIPTINFVNFFKFYRYCIYLYFLRNWEQRQHLALLTNSVINLT